MSIDYIRYIIFVLILLLFIDKIGLFIGSKIGLKSNYCAPVIYLSQPDKSKIIVLAKKLL